MIAMIPLTIAAWICSFLTANYCKSAPGQPSRARKAIRIFNLGAVFIITPIGVALLFLALS